MDKKSYLTDEQYLDILGKIEDKLNTNISIMAGDSDTIGDKSVSSNIGFCNDDFTTLETALFPDLFVEHGRKSMKQRLANHACPFDNRVRTKENLQGRLMNLGCGCFYTCSLQGNKPSNEDLKDYVADTKNKFLTGELDKINEIIRK
jgi:hypothetical protein